MKKKIIFILIGLCMILGVGVVYMMYSTTKEAEGIKLSHVDMKNIEDGTYVGEQRIGLVNVEVNVIVLNHKLVQVDLIKHETGMGQDAKEVIPKMIKENDIHVDVVSGATISSKTIMKACENALSKEPLKD